MLITLIILGLAYIVAQIIINSGKRENKDIFNQTKLKESSKFSENDTIITDKEVSKTEIIKENKKQNVNNSTIENFETNKSNKNIVKSENIIIPKNPITTFIKAKEEEQKNIKHIGYEPSVKFEHRMPLSYPMVFMPKPKSVIKFPRKGKQGFKGFTEGLFKQHILEYFSNIFQIFDDRFVLSKSNQNPYEPDFTLIDEKNDLNLFIDIEIDEPYDGVSRQPIHYVDIDKHRNLFFKNRGWIVIRFAEYQIYKETLSCCKFIAEVLKSVNENFIISEKFSTINDVIPIKQWTKKQSIIWANEKYRERYLGIDKFTKQEHEIILGDLYETEIGKEVEKHVNEEQIDSIEYKKSLINQAIQYNNFISCRISKKYTVIKPKQIENTLLIGFCYLKNSEVNYDINQLNDIILREKPFVFKITDAVGTDEIKSFIMNYIGSVNPIRIKYTKSDFGLYNLDRETGEFILSDEERKSLRTITNFDIVSRIYTAKEIAEYKLNDFDYISGFCNNKNDLRTFRFDRINELEILNI